MQTQLDHIDDIAANIKTFWFKPARPVHYTAGQFTEIYLPHNPHDNRGQKRWFTLSSSPSEAFLSITTKFNLERSSTFKQTLRALQPGVEVMLADPMGDFVLPKDTSTPLVFIAGGIGITPMRSMIKWLQDTGESRKIQLLYTVNKPEELVFRDLLSTYLGGAFMPIVKEANQDWQGLTGTLTAERILELAPAASDTLYYLSGPQPMSEALAQGLKAQGVNRQHIITDYFPGYAS